MRYVLIVFCFVSSLAFAQNDALFAQEYYKNGDFEKALIEYKRLYKKNKSSLTYIKKIVDVHQQLEQYTDAEIFLLEIVEKTKYPVFYVDLGYNYQLQGDLEKANENYTKALESVSTNPDYANLIASSFQNYALLDNAIIAYETGMKLKPKLNFNLALAQIYGEQGNIEKMMLKYINFAESNPIAISNIKRALSSFISENSEAEGNIILRKLLVKKIQKQPAILWNELLSWLFIQQRDFGKAFAQERAIFSREPENVFRVLELGDIAMKANEDEIASTIYNYVIENAQETDTKLKAYYSLLEIETKSSTKEDLKRVKDKYNDVFENYGKYAQTLKLQIAYAHFLAFYLDDTKGATLFLEETLNLPLSELEKAEVKLKLGDILLLQEKFNKALLYYTQIQRNVKNSTISQKARFKVAKASYYKGDFKWAESQLKILKSSTSQLIANDALDLKLLITDNKYEDSLQTALKLYAKADLLSFQNKNDDAIFLLNRILEEHKTEPIIPQALFKQAQLFEIKQQFNEAASNYEKIITNYPDGILIDNALYNLAELYRRRLNAPEKAKDLYKVIVFNHMDSIYFVEARAKFRKLRGDAIN